LPKIDEHRADPLLKKQTAVVTLDDFHRIREQCGLLQQESEQEIQAREKKEMWAKSKARVQNWPNTLQADRKRREEEKLKKLYEEEVN